MKKIAIDGIDIAEVASSWNELTAEQIMMVCSLSRSSLSLETFKIALFMLLTGLKINGPEPIVIEDEICWPMYHEKTKVRLLSIQELIYCLELLEFLFVHQSDVSVIESKLYKNLIPVIKVSGVDLHGPESALFNLSIAEFIRTEILYEQFLASGAEADLDKLCAVLYRRKDQNNHPTDPNFTGDVRIRFNDHLVNDNASLTKLMNPDHKMYIRLFYEGCRWYIFRGSNQFNNAFSGSGGSSGDNSFSEFMKLITALSNDDVTKAESVRTSLLYDVLFQLESIALQNIKLKSKSHV